MVDSQQSLFEDDSASIIQSFVSCGDQSLLRRTINERLKDVNQNNPDLFQTCKTINYLLSFISKYKAHDDELDLENVMKTCNTLLFTLCEENKHCYKLICAIFEKSFLLTENDKRRIVVSNILKRLEDVFSEHSNNFGDPLYIVGGLHVLDCLLNVYCNELDLATYFIISDNLKHLIIKLALSFSSDVSCEVVIAVIPKLVEFEKSNDVLIKLWKSIEFLMSNSSEKCEHTSRILTIICSLSSYYVGPFFTTNVKYVLEFEESFWELLIDSIVSKDGLQRKQSLYLLKRAIDFFDKSDLTFVDCKLFWWDSNCCVEVLSLWGSILLLFEVLEEKQVHLITPAFSAINKVIDATNTPFNNGKKLHSSWVISIFQRILTHDSNNIIKLGLLRFMEMNVCIYCETVSSSFLGQVFKSLNDMFLFDNLEIESSITLVIAEWFIGWSKCEHNCCFFNDLLSYFGNVQWSPIPLFHITNALTQIENKPSWVKSDLFKLKHFITEALRTQSIFIRGAIQCRLFKSLTLLINVENLSLADIADVISSFRSNECFKRGTETWQTCVVWLKSFVTTDLVNKFLECCKNGLFDLKAERPLSSLAMARMLVLLYDADLIVNNNFVKQELFEQVYECLHECGKRLYSSRISQDYCMKFLVDLMQEYVGINEKSNLIQGKFYRDICLYLNDLMELLKCRLLSACIATDIDSIMLYVSVIDAISLDESFLEKVPDEIHSLQQISCKILNDLNNNLVQQFFALKIVSWVLKTVGSHSKNSKLVTHNTEFIYRNLIIKLISCHDFTKFLRVDCFVDNSYVIQKSVNKFVSGAISSVWKFFEMYLSHCDPHIDDIFNKLTLNQLLQSGIEAISTGGREIIISVIRVFRVLFQYCKHSEEPLSYKLLSYGWDVCFELRKTELFWPAIENWIAMVYQKSLIETGEYKTTLINYAEKLIEKGNEVSGLVNILIVQLQSISYNTDLTFLINIILKCIVFGPVPRKDEKFEMETCKFIKSLNGACSVNCLLPSDEMRSDTEVRLRALDIVLIFVSNNNLRHKNLEIVIRGLIAHCKEMTKNNKRYFNDSRHHRIKHRILQVLLILETLLAESKHFNMDLVLEIFDWVVDSIMGESQQPSVRYQLEWLFTRMLIHNVELQDRFWIIFGKAACERIGSICSFISIAYHLAKLLDNYHFLEQCVENILPWCMAQNFNVRLYAQTVLQKIWQIDVAIAEKYSVIKNSQSKVWDQGNAMMNLKKMQSDFYFKAFHPIENFTLQVIYWDLPRLSNIASEELVPLTVVKRCLSQRFEFVPFGNETSKLTEFKSASWICKGSGKSDCATEASGIQKKYVPWKGMFQDEVESERKCGGLILVASLVDKPPNLGGLARTCEVFSAAELVLGNLQFIEDKQFTCLSLTAEKHLKISEVKPYNLDKYLKDMKNLGHSIVGAEQTSDSISLSTFRFPRRTVLVLGNEREGIPVNLLPLIDTCIEVPQFGVIRSLNVHVTGAIFLWEYAKQHLQK